MSMSRILVFLVFAHFIFAFSFVSCINCRPSCGNINIKRPFRLIGDPINCGHPNYELSCDNNRTILRFDSGKYFVESISYTNFTLRILDPGLLSNSCFPPIQYVNYSYYWTASYKHVKNHAYRISRESITGIFFLSCQSPVDSPQYINYTRCVNNSNSSYMYSYAVSENIRVSDLNKSCRIGMYDYFSLYDIYRNSNINITYRKTIFILNEVQQRIQKGIELEWYAIYCRSCWDRDGLCYTGYGDNYYGDYYTRSRDDNVQQIVKCEAKSCAGLVMHCYDDTPTTKQNVAKFISFAWIKIRVPLAYFLGGRALCGGLCFFIFLIYKFRRRHLSFDEGIEDFLQSHNNLGSIRYSYTDLRKMTNNFKEKLGQGGFGSVFKGKLRSGRLVAVKMLEKSQSKGQDFMSEVATIGRIHHVNVVQLSGFVADGSKRALIYDFMPNGSLEKYIFPQGEQDVHLSWEKMYKIAVGVANGIEYLHKGCEMQILHFDIKPHNILLDENFNARISDFGLAKLYQTDDSIVSLTAVRGTIGYMAPELFYKNIGGVSYKADVYSFGMLLMEMAGRRRNLNVHADSSSQIYFPLWVFEQLSRGKEMEIGDASQEDKIIAKKLAMVALWCIQMKPVDRPSMSKVVEMLKGDIEIMQMPPKLSLVPEDRVVASSAELSLTSKSDLSCNLVESISLDTIK